MAKTPLLTTDLQLAQLRKCARCAKWHPPLSPCEQIAQMAPQMIGQILLNVLCELNETRTALNAALERLDRLEGDDDNRTDEADKDPGRQDRPRSTDRPHGPDKRASTVLVP